MVSESMVRVTMKRMSMGEPFESVLRAAQSGAEWAFAELYDSYNAALLRYFASRAPRAAEDLASETWMGAARGLNGFDGGEAGFRSWLFTIAHRRLADHWDERRWESDGSSLPDYLAPDDPEALVVGNLSGQEAVRRIAGALPPDQAEIILLRVLAGLDVDQVAEIVNRPAGTVRVVQHRALKKLREDFSPDVVTERT